MIWTASILTLTLTPAISSINLEGAEAPLQFSTLLEHPELRHIGSNQRYALVPRIRPVFRCH
jgi:hypothetical protein